MTFKKRQWSVLERPVVLLTGQVQGNFGLQSRCCYQEDAVPQGDGLRKLKGYTLSLSMTQRAVAECPLRRDLI